MDADTKRNEELLTEAEAAEILGLAPATLRVWRCTGRNPGLAYYKIGRRVFYRRCDLEALIAASRREPGALPAAR